MSPEECESLMREQVPGATLRDEQREVLSKIEESGNVIGLLPTGSGKSWIFIAAALWFKKKYGTDKFSTILILPLVALNENHTDTLDKFGLSYYNMNGENMDRSKNVNDVDVILSNPEEFKKHLMKAGKKFQQKRVLFVVDEVHVLVTWHNFRGDFKLLDKYINFFEGKATVLGLTATLARCNKNGEGGILKKLGIGHTVKEVVRSPVKGNMSYINLAGTLDSRGYKIIADQIIGKEGLTPRILIFTQSAPDAQVKSSEIQELLPSHLRKHVTHISAVNTRSKQREILGDLLRVDGTIRVLVTTDVLGMGIDMKGVSYVMLTGMPNFLETYLQRSGRAGRDGTDCAVVLFSKDRHRCKNNMQQVAALYSLNEDRRCLRKLLASYFDGEPGNYSGLIGCCDICGISRNGFLESLISATKEKKSKPKLFNDGHPKRRVKKVLKKQFLKCLEEERQRQITQLYNGCPLAPIALTEKVILHISDQVKYLFTVEDIIKVVGCRYTAEQIFSIIKAIFGDIQQQEEMDVDC